MMEQHSPNVTINVQGSYIDVHGNDNVYFSFEGGKPKLKLSDPLSECPKTAPEKSTLRGLIIDKDRADALIACMRTLIQGQKGKMAALVVRCAMDKKLLSMRPTFEHLTSEFGDIGARNGYYTYLKIEFTPEEKKPVKDSLEACLMKA